jgi:hypothetical protein
MISNTQITLTKKGANSSRKSVYRQACLGSKWLSITMNNSQLTPVQRSTLSELESLFFICY